MMDSSFSCRLIAFDLDGTLLQKHAFLSPRTREALTKAQEKGIELVPATGRMLHFLPDCLTELPFLRYAITSNGAGVYDLRTEACLYANTFPPTLAASLVRYFLSLDLWVECYVNGHAWIHRATLEKGPDHYEIPENKRLFVQKPYRIAEDLPESLVCEQMAVEKINLPYLPPALRTMLWQKMDGMPDVTAVSSVDDNMELNVTGCDKGDGLRHLCEKLDIPLTHVFAMGDNGNDLTLLRTAGLSAAMKNGTQEAKKAASFVTRYPCEEDGAARCLEEILHLSTDFTEGKELSL